MDHSAAAALLAYAASLDPGLVVDEHAAEIWADQLRGIAVDDETGRRAVRAVDRRAERITPVAVRAELLALDPRAGRRWGTAVAPRSPYESDYQRAQRLRRGLDRVRAVLAQDQLPITDTEEITDHD